MCWWLCRGRQLAVVEVVVSGHFGTEIDPLSMTRNAEEEEEEEVPPSSTSPSPPPPPPPPPPHSPLLAPSSSSSRNLSPLHCLIHLASFLGGNDVVIIVLVQVFFCCEILVFLMFQVHLDQRGADSWWSMWVGVTTAAPGTLTLPSDSDQWKSAVVIHSGGVDECGSAVSADRQERLWIHISNIWIYLLSPVGRSVCPSSSLLLLFRSVLLQCDSEIQGDHMEVEIP